MGAVGAGSEKGVKIGKIRVLKRGGCKVWGRGVVEKNVRLKMGKEWGGSGTSGSVR